MAPGHLVGVALIEIDGAPTTFPILDFSRFGPTGPWTPPATVPPGLAGLSLGFRTYAFGIGGGLVESNLTILEMLGSHSPSLGRHRGIAPAR